MIFIVQPGLKILCAAGLLILALAVLFVLNALRMAVASYWRKPIRKYYQTLSAKEDYVPYHRIPASAEIVLIATEDNDFLTHHGFSVRSILLAMKKNLIQRLEKGEKCGGSGITQQLVKNLYLSSEKNYSRKLAELFLAVWVELWISKRQIAELYCNIVYFGRSQYGLGHAARYYMNKQPIDLSLNQLVSLLCILPSPDCYNPLDHPELFQKAREITLHRLCLMNSITPEYARALAAMPWDADSGANELTIVRSFLTKCPCYRANLRSREPKYVAFRQNGPSGLMLHSVGCARSDPGGFLEQWNRRDFDDACVHAFIDANDGTVYQTLPWDFRGWHCGGAANNTHLGVEMCEPDCIRYTEGASFEVLDPAAAEQFARRVYSAAVKLFAALCRSRHLESTAIISHREGHALGLASDHLDPEHLWRTLGLDLSMDRFRADVQSRMDGEALQLIYGPPRRDRRPILKRLWNFFFVKYAK